jgi:hypothetical protein
MRLTYTLLALGLTVALTACGQKPAETGAANPPAAAPTTAPAEPAAPPAAPAPTTVATADKTGIPECDDYLTKYEACVNSKLPADQRGTFATSIAQSRAAWKTAAENPGSRDIMKQTCTTALEQTRTAMKAYGCDM